MSAAGSVVAPLADAPDARERRFAYDGATLRVRCDDPAPLAWLAEFIAPEFAPLDGPGAAADDEIAIELELDARAFAAMLAAGRLPERAPVDGFALDNSVVPLVPWSAAADERVYCEERLQVFLRFRAGERAVRLLAAPENLGARAALMRVAREIAMHRAHADGGFFLHASAVAFGERGIVVAGPKAAGKTTFLLHLLRQRGARYLSNDRVHVRVDGPDAQLRGMPTIATLRPRTLELLPEIAARLRASGFRFRLSLDEVARLRPGPLAPGSDGKVGLSPAQLCSLVPVSRAATARASALVLPRITNAPGTIALEPVEPRVAAARLEDALFGIHTWRKSSELFAFGAREARPEAAAIAMRCARLTEVLPCFECRLGEQAYSEAGARASEEALARLLG